MVIALLFKILFKTGGLEILKNQSAMILSNGNDLKIFLKSLYSFLQNYLSNKKLINI